MPQQDPALVQWQMRFDRASKASSEPRRPSENPQQFQQRQQSMAQVLRHLQTSKPVPQPKPQGKPASGTQKGEGLYGLIARKMGGG
jgi:hypothetical protein